MDDENNKRSKMKQDAIDLLERVLAKIDSEWLVDYDKSLCDDIKAYIESQKLEE